MKIQNLKKNNLSNFNFLEKVYNKNNNNWELSVILSREKLLKIMKLFIGNNKGSFIKETKKLITDIKKHSFNLSAKAFDENAIDTYANVIWKNFPPFCTYFLRLGINQQINVSLNIKDNEWFFRDNKLFQVIGEQTEFEKDRKKEIISYETKNAIKMKITNII